MASTPGSAASSDHITVLSCGDVSIDVVVEVDQFPAHGGEVFSKETTLGLGGSAANTAIALNRLGLGAGVLGQVGDDELGKRAISLLDTAGVDTTAVGVEDAGITAVNVVMVTPDGERTMISTGGPNRDCRVDRTSLDKSDWIHISGYSLLGGSQRDSVLEALDVAVDRDIGVSIDIPSGVAGALGESLEPVLTRATVVAVGHEGLRKVFPNRDGRGVLISAGVDTVAVTAGEGRVTVDRADQQIGITPPQTRSVDSTGAGDNFMAGLITGSIWGLSLGEMTTLAITLGAAATMHRGAGNEEDWHIERILRTELWSDVDPAWLETSRRLLASL